MSSLASDEARNGSGAAASIPSGPTRKRSDEAPPIGRARMLAAVAGIVAGLASFGIGEAVYQKFHAEQVERINPMSHMKVMWVSRETQVVAVAKNAALAFAALGVCLGGLMGTAGGLARRSSMAAITAGLIGAGLGAIAGGAVTRPVLAFFLKAQDESRMSDVVVALVTHALIWGLIGAAAGLAMGIGLRDRRVAGSAVMAGLLGAVLASIAFDMIGMVFFSAARTAEPISETWPTRLLARLMVSVGTAAAVALCLPSGRANVDHHKADAA